MTADTSNDQPIQSLVETLSDGEKTKALEMGDYLLRTSEAVLKHGDAQIVSEAVAELVQRVNNAEGLVAANTVLEALHTAKNDISVKHNFVEAHRVDLEIAIVETAINTRRLLTMYKENSR